MHIYYLFCSVTVAPVLCFKFRRRGDPVVSMWITDCAFKACQDAFLIRVMGCWSWGNLKVECLNYLYYKKNTPSGRLFEKRLQTQRCKACFCIPIGEGSIFLLSFIRQRLKSTRHHRSFSNAKPSQPWGSERAISCLIWSESPHSRDWGDSLMFETNTMPPGHNSSVAACFSCWEEFLTHGSGYGGRIARQ